MQKLKLKDLKVGLTCTLRVYSTELPPDKYGRMHCVYERVHKIKRIIKRHHQIVEIEFYDKCSSYPERDKEFTHVFYKLPDLEDIVHNGGLK